MCSDLLLQRVKKVRISDTVVDQIIALIEEGKLPVGARLPGERELLSQLQVGRASVREALRILEAQRVIEVRPGKGAFIISDIVHLSEYEGIRLWFEEHIAEFLKLLEIREALEMQAAAMASVNASMDQLEEIKAVLDETEEQVTRADWAKVTELDQEFHRMLAQASDNDLLAQIVAAIIEAMVEPRRSLLRIPGRAKASLQEHRAIFRAVKNHGATRADEAVKAHIAHVRLAIGSLGLREAGD